MKLGFGKSVLFMSVNALASAMFARGVMSVAQFDIFSSCIDQPENFETYMCRNANDLIQVMTFGIAMFVFFGVLYAFWVQKESRRRMTIHAALLSIAYFGLLVANWKIITGLQDNFFALSQFNRGIPETFNEYAYLLYNRIGDVGAGIILGVAAWLPEAASRNTIDANKRKEPRLVFAKGEVKKTSTPAKKAATKKAPAKKAPAKKKPAAKKKAPAKK